WLRRRTRDRGETRRGQAQKLRLERPSEECLWRQDCDEVGGEFPRRSRPDRQNSSRHHFAACRRPFMVCEVTLVVAPRQRPIPRILRIDSLTCPSSLSYRP